MSDKSVPLSTMGIIYEKLRYSENRDDYNN
jgi:hypothetical protein